ARVTGQAEHALAEDVLHDLRGAALDRVRARAQELILGEPLGRAALEAALAQLVARFERETVAAQYVDRELPQALVDLGLRELADRALRPRVAGPLRGARALVGDAQELVVHPGASHSVAHDRFL